MYIWNVYLFTFIPTPGSISDHYIHVHTSGRARACAICFYTFTGARVRTRFLSLFLSLHTLTHTDSDTCARTHENFGTQFFFLAHHIHGLCLWSRARNSNPNSRLNERAVTKYNAHLHIWCTIELGMGVWFVSNIHHLHATHIFLRYLQRSKSKQQMIEYSWSL